MKITEVTGQQMDRNTEMMRGIIQQAIDKKDIQTAQEIKKYIVGLKLAGLVQYKEDIITLFKRRIR